MKHSACLYLPPDTLTVQLYSLPSAYLAVGVFLPAKVPGDRLLHHIAMDPDGSKRVRSRIFLQSRSDPGKRSQKGQNTKIVPGGDGESATS